MFIRSQNKDIILNTDATQALRVYDEEGTIWIGTEANRDQLKTYPINLGEYLTGGRGIEVLNAIFEAIERGDKTFQMPQEFRKREVYKA